MKVIQNVSEREEDKIKKAVTGMSLQFTIFYNLTIGHVLTQGKTNWTRLCEDT